MTKLKVKVTKEILFQSRNCGLSGKEWIVETCAISVAIRDIFPKASVSANYIRAFQGTNTLIDLPPIAHEFIEEFDSSSPEMRVKMEEIEFEVDIPDVIIEEIRPLLEHHPTLQLV